MSNLIFSINATLPLILVVVLGVILRKTGFLDKEFAKKCDRFVFYFTVPPTLFLNMYEMDLRASFDTRLLLFCMIATVLSIVGAFFLGKAVIKDSRGDLGEFIQAAYRSSVALLGYALILSLCGQTTHGPVMILGSVPLYNIAAVLILVLTSPDSSHDTGKQLTRALLGIAKNPIILGIAAGSIASLIRLPVPTALQSAAKSVGSLTTPLILISIGISFEGTSALGKLRPSLIAACCKLILIPLIFLPVAVLMGFRAEALITILIMLGSPLTPSGYTMARKYGHSGVITASAIVLTTMGSALTLTVWITVLKALQLI